MDNKMILDKRNRDFFRIVAKAAFSNPFEEESFELTCKMAKGKYDAGDILIKKAKGLPNQSLYRTASHHLPVSGHFILLFSESHIS